MLDGPSNVMYYNKLVVNNTSLPQYTLVQKHNVVNCHFLREATAAGILRVIRYNMETKLDDLLTKILGWQQRHKLLLFVLYPVQLR